MVIEDTFLMDPFIWYLELWIEPIEISIDFNKIAGDIESGKTTIEHVPNTP